MRKLSIMFSHYFNEQDAFPIISAFSTSRILQWMPTERKLHGGKMMGTQGQNKCKAPPIFLVPSIDNHIYSHTKTKKNEIQIIQDIYLWKEKSGKGQGGFWATKKNVPFDTSIIRTVEAGLEKRFSLIEQCQTGGEVQCASREQGMGHGKVHVLGLPA